VIARRLFLIELSRAPLTRSPFVLAALGLVSFGLSGMTTLLRPHIGIIDQQLLSGWLMFGIAGALAILSYRDVSSAKGVPSPWPEIAMTRVRRWEMVAGVFGARWIGVALAALLLNLGILLDWSKATPWLLVAGTDIERLLSLQGLVWTIPQTLFLSGIAWTASTANSGAAAAWQYALLGVVVVFMGGHWYLSCLRLLNFGFPGTPHGVASDVFRDGTWQAVLWGSFGLAAALLSTRGKGMDVLRRN